MAVMELTCFNVEIAGEYMALIANHSPAMTPAFDLNMFEGGDIITAVNGAPITSRNDFQLALEEKYKPGDKIDLTVWRDGKTETVTVTLEEL